jgi:hypothetical protein
MAISAKIFPSSSSASCRRQLASGSASSERSFRMVWAFSLLFQKSGAAAAASRAAICCSRPATSKMPPEEIEARFETREPLLQLCRFDRHACVQPPFAGTV